MNQAEKDCEGHASVIATLSDCPGPRATLCKTLVQKVEGTACHPPASTESQISLKHGDRLPKGGMLFFFFLLVLGNKSLNWGGV